MKRKTITFLSVFTLLFALGLMPALSSNALATGNDCMDDVCELIADAQADMDDAATYIKKIGLIRRTLGKRQLVHAHACITGAQFKLMDCTVAALPLDMIAGILPHNMAELQNLIQNVLPSMLPLIPDILINPIVETMTVEQVLIVVKIVIDSALIDTHGILDIDALNNIAVAQRILDNLNICN